MNGDANRTECAFVDTWLDDWLAGRVPDVVARRIESHAATCDRCARLITIVRDAGPNAERPDEDAGFLPEVLRLTTGSACARAESLLPDLVDGELDADSREILEGHLLHCTPCSHLLAALQDARVVLPALAQVEPPPGFAQAVLQATTAARPAPSRVARAADRSTAFGQWILRVLARPRASLEIAYVATVLLIVVFGNPVAAYHDAEQRAGRLARVVPVAQITGDLAVKRTAAAGTIERLFAPLVAAAKAVAADLAERWRQARVLLDEITARAADAINWLATIDLRAMIGGSRAPTPGQPAAGSHPAPAVAQPQAGRR